MKSLGLSRSLTQCIYGLQLKQPKCSPAEFTVKVTAGLLSKESEVCSKVGNRSEKMIVVKFAINSGPVWGVKNKIDMSNQKWKFLGDV